VLLAVLVAVVLGVAFGGWRSPRLSRQLDMAAARRSAWRGASVAGGSGIALTFVMLGWPWREKSATPTIVMRQVERPVRGPFLGLFRKRGKETVSVPEVGPTPAPSLVFDGALIPALLFIGVVCAALEWGLISACRRWFC
jgi:hypothetical protein